MSRMDQSMQMEKEQMTYNSQSLVQEDEHYESMQHDLSTSGIMLPNDISGIIDPQMQSQCTQNAPSGFAKAMNNFIPK